VRKPTVVLSLLVVCCLAGWAQTSEPRGAAEDPQGAAEILERFFEASGGFEKLRTLRSASLTAEVEAYAYQYAMHLLADGRFCVQAPDRKTVYDGERYWEVYYGVVTEVSGSRLDQVRGNHMGEILLHGLIDEDGKPAKLGHQGLESARGQTYAVLSGTSPTGNPRTLYFNTTTGLLDKIVELVPDPDLRELKNVYTFGEYRDIDGLMLPTRVQGLCLTNNESVQPLTRYSDIELNAALPESLFARPVSGAPPVRLEGGVLIGHVRGISGGGSLITSISADHLEALGVADGGMLRATVRGREQQLLYRATIDDFGSVGSGDYLATFNDTPALWLVKAYVGYISDDSTYAEGDEVRLGLGDAAEGETE